MHVSSVCRLRKLARFEKGAPGLCLSATSDRQQCHKLITSQADSKTRIVASMHKAWLPLDICPVDILLGHLGARACSLQVFKSQPSKNRMDDEYAKMARCKQMTLAG